MIELTILNVFLIIAAIAVIIVTALIVVALVYFILFIRAVKQVANTAQRATEIVTKDVIELKKNIQNNGISLGAFAKFIKALAGRKSNK